MGVDKNVSEGRKRWILSIRTTADGRQRLLDAADASGRSLSDEIESRLQRSFQTDDTYGGVANAAFVNLLGSVIRDVEAETGQSWLSEPSTWATVRARVLEELDRRKPDPKQDKRRAAAPPPSASARGRKDNAKKI